MPKLIDNYVLNRKIGAGQYGQVFRGYDRATNLQIAVKSIKRQNVKGKFKQLLESEIKVLKSCENSHIIKLYDMKKTSNNFYLILQYCNDGDLEAYVKKRRYLVQDEAIEIFIEIVGGFKHLCKHNIMHRDLKLANILRHEGQIKIADFGFSKMLKEEDLAATMLGSPLNMAPEVLQNMEYSNKADVYSLGVCFYWMLYGKPPFNAKNVIELKAVIMKQEIAFPKAINKISAVTEKLIRQMLKANPAQRISWQEIFDHPINDFLEKKMEKQMAMTLTMDGSFSDNISKLYLNQNLVIIHPAEFKRREEVAAYAADALKDGKKKEFKGDMLKKDIKQQEERLKLKRADLKGNQDKINDKATEDEQILDSIKTNTFFLLNERNCIIFMLSVMSELRDKKDSKMQGELLWHMIALCKQRFEKLDESVQERANAFKLRYWEEFIESSAFKNLEHFFTKEQVVVSYELGCAEKLAKKSEESYQVLVKKYCQNCADALANTQLDEKNRQDWIHMGHLMDIARLHKIMNEDFDFKHYYNEFGKFEMKELVDNIKGRIKTI